MPLDCRDVIMMVMVTALLMKRVMRNSLILAMQIDRMLDVQSADETGSSRLWYSTVRQFLIKWEGKTYSESTYEHERDLIMMNVEYDPTMVPFWNQAQNHDGVSHHLAQIISSIESKWGNRWYQCIYYINTSTYMRDYQAEGIVWLVCKHLLVSSS